MQALAVDGGRVWACVGQEVVVWGRPAVGIGGKEPESSNGQEVIDGSISMIGLSDSDGSEFLDEAGEHTAVAFSDGQERDNSVAMGGGNAP